ncbi:hypothetical protein SISNIDRAFT_440167 [Sistotremastrum niveocremeum HHB9708]|uniref:Uncharacterized protein n=1 Tax=Sistotremastrum niveocremeum HHB9708 TaxID=1314777 RepID=A0A164VZK6_9AGAM|nr:hypothetical protein SISNIDRAFT_440167 [Sistotremastrum niveocremeum HHB9708]
MVLTRDSVTAPENLSRSNSSNMGGKGKGKYANRLAPSPFSKDANITNETTSTQEYDISHPEDGKSPNTTPKSKGKGKGKKVLKVVAKKSRSSLWERLAPLVLLTFTVYTITTCPTDYQNKSPVCWGLSQYRELVLEPLIYPPFHAALRHPQVAPRIARVQPYIHQFIRFSTPYVQEGHRQYHRHVVPAWTKYVTPRIKQLEAQISPYIQLLLAKYEALTAPYYAKYRTLAAPYYSKVHELQTQVQPYVEYAITRSEIQYRRSLPYLRPAWEQAKRVPGLIVTRVYLPSMRLREIYIDPHAIRAFRRLSAFVVEYRKLYVDRHVLKIWTQVQELAVVESGSAEESATITYSITHSIPLPSADEPTSHNIAEVTVTVDAASETPETASLVSSTPLITHSSSESIHTHSSSVLASSSSSFSSLPTPVAQSSAAASSSAPPADDIDPDFEALLQDVFREGTESQKEETPTPGKASVPEPTAESEAEKERRLAEVAQKRADVVERHAKWETKLQQRLAELLESVPEAISKIRLDALAEIQASKSFEKEIERVNSEAEKALRNSEKYVKSLISDEKWSKEEKDRLWEKVLIKVDEKFADRIQYVEQLVGTWWQNLTEQELKIAEDAFEELRDLGGKGQADLGMDYAWLEDVTYHDWQRYHALADVATHNRVVFYGMQDGTHPNAPENPISQILSNLQTELQEIADGFEAQLTKIQREGYSRITEPIPEETASEEPIPSETDVSEPQFSILPIEVPESVLEIEPLAVLSRGKEEVEEAFQRADPDAFDAEASLASDASEPLAVNEIVSAVESEEIKHTEL